MAVKPRPDYWGERLALSHESSPNPAQSDLRRGLRLGGGCVAQFQEDLSDSKVKYGQIHFFRLDETRRHHSATLGYSLILRRYRALCIKRTNRIRAKTGVVNHLSPMQDKSIDGALLALRKNIIRGKFTAGFFLQSLKAIGVGDLRL